MFVVDNVTRLNADGTPMKDILAGYMPIGRQHGFLFGVPAAKYVAHELGHGAFGLHHTFSSETESFSAPQYSTDNLMDYADGTTLNHKQWRWMHEKHRNVLGFLDDEGESEAAFDNSTLIAVLEQIRKANNQDKQELDISLYSNKEMEWSNVKLQDNFILEYLSMNISTGKNIGTQDNPLQFEALLINPILLHVESCTTPAGQEGKFVKAYYNRLEKTTSIALKTSESDNLAIEFVIKESQIEELKEYLYIVIKANATWVSQFDRSIFGNCSCFKDKACCFQCSQYIVHQSTNLYSPVDNRMDIMKFPTSNQPLTTMQTPVAINGMITEATKYIDKALRENKPIVVGVYYRERQDRQLKKTEDILPNLNKAKNELKTIIDKLDKFGEDSILIDNRDKQQSLVNELQGEYDKYYYAKPFNQTEPTFHYVVIDGKKYDVDRKLYYYHFIEVGTESKDNGMSSNNRLYVYDKEIKGQNYNNRGYTLTEIRTLQSSSNNVCP